MSSFELGQAMALDLPTDHKMAVMMLAAAVDEYGLVKIDMPKLATRCGMTAERLDHVLDVLQRCGVLEQVDAHVDGFIQDMFLDDNWYRLDLSATDALPPAEPARLAQQEAG